MNTKQHLVTWLTIVGGLAALGGSVTAYWPHVGWVTPSQHEASYDEAVGGLKDFRDEWKCDEYDEELLDLLTRQQAGDDSTETQHTIDKLREKMRALDCQRFEDYG